MKHLLTLVVFLFLSSNSVLSFQGATPPPQKKQPSVKIESVDCSKVDDATLVANVRDKLANTPSLKDATIHIVVKDGTVTLTGLVKKPTNKGLASLQTRRIACIKKIDNQLAVEGSTTKEKKPKS
jgi:hypothetical protein